MDRKEWLELKAFEVKVIETARQKYGAKTAFSTSELNAIREELKKPEKIDFPEVVPVVEEEIIEKVEKPKRKRTKK